LPVFHNLIKDLELAAPNQVWVSDITYIRTGSSFIYVSLITDAYSRKIVGWNAGDTLEAIGCLNALQGALKELPGDCSPIHHSDRSCQYCCHAYVKALKKAGLKTSMTEQNHCYENALAERVNGILKDEYNLFARFTDKKQAIRAIKQALYLYNNKRPHLALDYQFPVQVHEKVA
jgi:transposase InsO family protein